MADKETIKTLRDLIMQLAQEEQDEDPFVQMLAEGALNGTVENLARALETIQKRKGGMMADDGALTPEALDEMAVLASEFDASGDPLLMKQAALLDEILLTIGAPHGVVAAAKRAQDNEVAKIKNKNKTETVDLYKFVKEEHDKQNRVVEAVKAINDKVKEYRPLEAAMSTRSCPDHPGAQLGRIGENIYQCSMDKGVYDFQAGFTTMKGNKVPGGDVSTQTQALEEQPNEMMSFDSRESRLNS